MPFAGSGSAVCGAMLVGWEDVLAIERELEYADIALESHKREAALRVV